MILNTLSPQAQHAGNVIAVALPAAGLLSHLPEALSTVLVLMGIAWYGVLFYDRFKNKIKADRTPPTIHKA